MPLAILIAVLVVGGLWWLRTRHMEFMTPKGTMRPLPEFMRVSERDDPSRDSDPASPGPAVVDPLPPTPNNKPDQPPLEFGDLESSPGLAEYSEHASKGAGYLIRLATELEVRGQWERSLLAWERVLDSCTPSDAEREIAEDSLERIRPTLPFWNIDPEGDLPILLQLGTARQKSEQLMEAAQAVAEIIRKDSDHTLLVTPRVTTASSPPAEKNAPIAVYFSGDGDGEDSGNDILPVTPEGDEVATYQNQLLITAYQLVRRSLLNVGGIVPPNPATNAAMPERDFTRKITRLHWKHFARSLVSPPAAPSE